MNDEGECCDRCLAYKHVWYSNANAVTNHPFVVIGVQSNSKQFLKVGRFLLLAQ